MYKVIGELQYINLCLVLNTTGNIRLFDSTERCLLVAFTLSTIVLRNFGIFMSDENFFMVSTQSTRPSVQKLLALQTTGWQQFGSTILLNNPSTTAEECGNANTLHMQLKSKSNLRSLFPSVIPTQFMPKTYWLLIKILKG